MERLRKRQDLASLRLGLHHSLLDNLDYRLDQAAPYNTTLSYANVPIASPVSGAPGLISPSNVQTDIATPAVVSYAFSIEQQLDRATSITIGYVGSHGYQQILSEDQNEPASIICSAASTCPAGTSIGTIYYPTIVKANPLVANTTSWISGGSSNYNALEVDLRRNLHGFQFRANYTYAKNLDNGSAWNTSVSANTPAFVSYPANPSLDYGPAATDVRHLAAFNATYELPIGRGQPCCRLPRRMNRAVSGWSLSTIATLQTGFPFSPSLDTTLQAPATPATLYAPISPRTSREASTLAEAQRLASRNSSPPQHSAHPSMGLSEISVAIL